MKGAPQMTTDPTDTDQVARETATLIGERIDRHLETDTEMAGRSRECFESARRQVTEFTIHLDERAPRASLTWMESLMRLQMDGIRFHNIYADLELAGLSEWLESEVKGTS